MQEVIKLLQRTR